MKNTDLEILASVKTVAAENGLAGITSRRLGRAAGVNSGLIYHYFESMEQVLQKAFCMEWQGFIDSVLANIADVEDIPFSLRDKARLCFHRLRRELLAQRERTLYICAYRSSNRFQDAAACYEAQLDRVANKLEPMLDRLTLRCLLSLLLDSAALDQPEEPLFALWYRLFPEKQNE